MNHCPNCGHNLNQTTPSLPSLLCKCGTNVICPLHGNAISNTPRFNANSGCLFDAIPPEDRNKPMSLSCPCPKHSVTC